MADTPSATAPADPADRAPAPADPAPRPHRFGTRWWHRAPVWVRRTARQLAIVGLTGLVAITFGVFTASADTRLGPHEATISTDVSHLILLDLGPLGSANMPSPAPWPLGVRVDVREIPATLSEVENPLQSIGADVASYAAFFANPELGIREAAEALISDALRRTVLVWSLLLVSVAIGQLAAGGLLRAEVREKLRRAGVAPLAAATALAVIAVPVGAAVGGRQPAGRPSAVLADLGGPLTQVRVTGQVAALLDTYGEMAIEELRKNDAYYAQIAENVQVAYDANRYPVRPPRSLPSQLPAPIAPDTTALAAVDPITLLVVSDIHCNTGIAQPLGEIARLSEAEIILNAGDSTLGGSSVESICIDSLARAFPQDVPVVVADGNHDSRDTSAQEEKAGWTVLNGDVIEIEGVTFVGDVDSRLTSVTLGNHEYRTRTEAGLAIEEAACAAVDDDDPEDYVDILLLHDPYTGARIMPSGCVGLEISGHLHRRIGPVQQGLGLLYLNDTSGGASAGHNPIGPLRVNAYATVISYDRATKAPIALREVTMSPDQSVQLGDWEPFPSRPIQVQEADLSIEAWPDRG